MAQLYEVTVTDKFTGEVIETLSDVEEAYRTEDLITGEVITRLTRKGNRTFKYENSQYDITIINK